MGQFYPPYDNSDAGLTLEERRQRYNLLHGRCTCSAEEVIGGHRPDCPLNVELAAINRPLPPPNKPFEEMTRDEMIVAHAHLRASIAEFVTGYHESEKALDAVVTERQRLLDAIKRHHGQKADDRCWFDDGELYRAAGLEAVDLHVGDQSAMLKNCARYIACRTIGGVWPTYVELEAQLAKANEELQSQAKALADLQARHQLAQDAYETLAGYKPTGH